MNCPSCDLPLLYAAATTCPRCGCGLGDSGPANLPLDTPTETWRSIRTAIVVVAFALVLFGIYGYLTNWRGVS